MLFDSIKLTEGSSISNMTVASGADFPVVGDLGELYFHVPDSKLYVYSGSSWDAIGTSTTLAGLANVARTGSFNDLINKPVYAVVATTGSYTDLVSIPTFASVATSGSYADLLNKPALATVATSGSYADLSAKPTIASLGGVATTAIGVANGVAGLDAAGLVPAGQLPSYVDDVVEFDTLATFPVTGERGKIYVTLNDSKVYRWSGTQYVEIIASPGTTDAIIEGTTNLYFTAGRAYTASPVKYVAGRQGAIVLTTADIGGLSAVGSSGLYVDLINAPVLATVATSGSYTDLADKPSISLTGDITSSGTGTLTTTLATVNSAPVVNGFRKVTVNGKGLVTATSAVVDTDITSVLGYTPYDSSNPSSFITSAQAPVQSVAGHSGVVTLAQADIGGLHVTDSPTFAGVTATTFAGNASTATKFAAPQAINGVNFDGSSAITVTAAASTLTGTTINSSVTGSSLTSVGTLTGLASSGAVSITNTTNATGANTGALKVAGGASIGGDLYIAGSMMVAGSLTTVSSSVITVTDPMIYLGSGNATDIVDLGLIAAYTASGEKHTGIIRDASDGTWKFFDSVSPEPTSVIDFTSAVYSPVKMGSLTATTSFLGATTVTDATANPKLTLVRTGSTGNVQIQYSNDAGTLYSGIQGSTFAWGANADLATLPFMTLTSTAAAISSKLSVSGEITANDINITGNAAAYNSFGGLNISHITGATGTIEYKAYSNSAGTGGVSHAFKIGNITAALVNGSGLAVTGSGTFNSLSVAGTAATNTTILQGNSTTTGGQAIQLLNTSGNGIFAIEGSVGGNWAAGTSPYSTVIGSKTGSIQFSANNGAAVQATISSTGLAVTGGVTTTGRFTSTQVGGVSFSSISATTQSALMQVGNTNGLSYFGNFGSTAGTDIFITGGHNYYTMLGNYQNYGVDIFANSAVVGTFSSSGLGVTGTISSGTTGANGQIILNRASDGAGAVSMQVDGSQNYTFNNGAGAGYLFKISGTTQATLDTSGSLLQGQTSSSYSATGRVMHALNGATSSMIALAAGGANKGYLYSDSSSVVLWAEATASLTIGTASATNIQFKTNNNVQATIDTSGAIGLGVIPSSWAATNKVIDLNTGGAIYGTSNGVTLASNVYHNGTNWIAKTTAGGGIFTLYAGNAILYNAPSVTAGSIASITELLRVDANGNMGLGVVPYGWSGTRAFDIGVGNALFGSNSGGGIVGNAYYNGANWIYKTTNVAAYYHNQVGTHQWFVAASGTAGTTISTFATPAMTLDNNGNFGLGAVPSSWGTGYKAIEMLSGNFSSYPNATTPAFFISSNTYFNGTNWVYKQSRYATRYKVQNDDGSHSWDVSAIGTAGNTVAFTQAMTLNAAGLAVVGSLKITGALITAQNSVTLNNIDVSAGSVFSKTATSAITWTVSNVSAAGTVVSFILDLTNGGAFTQTWWAGVKWPSGIIPTLTVAGRDSLGFYTYDGGTTWTGLILGRDIK
jgi:hypothetical protein